jgi:hypothetical protein
VAVTAGRGGHGHGQHHRRVVGLVSAPPNVSFSATLNGLNQTVIATQALDVSDATGSGAGWSISATATTFTTGGAVTLATNSTTINPDRHGESMPNRRAMRRG